MVPAGYLYRRVEKRSDWIANTMVQELCTLSPCLGDSAPAEPHERHNAYFLFDDAATAGKVAWTAIGDLTGYRLFYFEAGELEWDLELAGWRPRRPPSGDEGVKVKEPLGATLLGFDVMERMPEDHYPVFGHSLLACYDFTSREPVNQHCLLASHAEAVAAVERGFPDVPEFEALVVVAVYEIANPTV